MQLTTATTIAQDIMLQLSSACVRIEIAGSIRRGKPDVGDIELVAIPDRGTYEVKDMFDQVVERHHVNHLEDAIDSLLAGGAWAFDTDVKRNGPKYKRLRHVATGLCCDLFITDQRRWGYTFTVRTGPGDFSKALVSRALIRRMFFKDGLLHNHPPVYEDRNGQREVKPCESGERCLRIMPTLEEADVFAALGLAYIEPRDRTLSAIMRPLPAR